MIPVRLQIENFMNHRNSDIDFSQIKSALIVAKNKNNDRESNGLGKTTVFSAIEYALYGEVPTSTVDKIVRDGSDRCSVIFDFKIKNIDYRIHRIRSKQGRAELKLFQKNGNWEKLSGTRIPEVEAAISDLIKINYKSFIHSVKFAQNDLNGLASAKKPEARKEILKEPLQLTDYTKLEKIAKDKASIIRKELESIETSIVMLADPHADIKAAELELSISDNIIKNKDGDVKKLSASLEEKKEFLAQLKKSLNSSDSQLHDTIVGLEKKFKESKQKTLKSTELIQKLSRDMSDNSDKLTKAQKELAALQVNLENQPQYREPKLIADELEKVRNDELLGNKLLARCEAEYDQAKRSLPNGDFCSHCLQPITPEHRQKCEDEANKTLEEKSKQITITKTNLTKCANKKTKLQLELDAARKTEQEKRNIANNIQSLTKNISIYTETNETNDKWLNKSITEAEINQSELREIQDSLASHKKLAESSDVPELNAKIFAISDEIKLFDKSIENTRNDLSNAQKRHGAAQEKLSRSKNNLTNLELFKTKQQDFGKKMKTAQLVVNAFSPKGIPTFIIYTILDELQSEANHWLNRLRPELEIEFDREIDMKFRVSGQEREYEQLSVGQKVYIALALKLGLSRVIQKKIGIDIGFLELDEVDQSLDKAGVEAFADVVKKLEDEFMVLIVTHNDALKDRFGRAILVEADGLNGATAKVVTSW